jgi:TatD DNase family protein
MIDSHCHLNLQHFDDDREGAIARAVSDGVIAFVNIGYDRASLRETMELIEEYPFVFGAAGVHPHDAASLNDELEAKIRQALDHPRVVAVGEIGLDFHRTLSPREVQVDVFRRMIKLAREKDKPIVIHCREAFNEVIDVLESEGGSYRGVFHAFSAGEAEARKVAELGFHVGIGGVVTYRNARLDETVATIPIDRIVLETDSPYLTPHPWRGKRNEPSFVTHVARTVARTKGLSPVEVDRATTESTLAAFGLSASALPRPVYKIEGAVYIQAATAEPADLDAVPSEGVSEAIITGFTDPLERPEHVLALASSARARGWRVRVNTTGLANQAAGRDVTPELAGNVDEVNIVLFGATAKAHDELAFPAVGGEGWGSIREFVRGSVAAGIETVCEFIAVPGFEAEQCREFTRDVGAKYDIRMYRS